MNRAPFLSNLSIPVRDFFIFLGEQFALACKQSIIGSLQRDHRIGRRSDSRHYIERAANGFHQMRDGLKTGVFGLFSEDTAD